MSSKILSKGFERSVYWNEYNKIKNKNTTNEYLCFLKSNSVGVNTRFLVYSNQDENSKRLKTRRYYLPNSITDKYYVIVNGKSFITKSLILIQNDMKM